MIVIIDYGMGNISSILNMLKKSGSNAVVSSDIEVFEKANKFILPGVGAFDTAIKNLQNRGLIHILNKKVVQEKRLILGICLGMQLFTKNSEEGNLDGLGWIDARTIKFQFNELDQNLKIPHMGWNTICINKKNSLFKDMYEEPRFYFVHSYHVVCNNKQDILTTTHHGYEFASSIQKDNIIGVQFHPEKSHKFGVKLLKNFVEL